MRKAAGLMIGVCVCLALAPVAFGDEFRGKAPQEQSWVRYHVSTQPNNEEEQVGTWTFKSLGQATQDGDNYRWFESEYKTDTGQHHERRKLLIRDQAVQSSERPFEEGGRCLKQDNQDAVASVPLEDQGWLIDEFLSFPGFLKNATLQREPRTIQYQGGALDVEHAYVGTYRWSRPGQPPEDTSVFVTEYRVWLHPKLPVGFAHAELTLRLSNSGKTVRSWRIVDSLQDFGNDPEVSIKEESAPELR